MRDIIGRDAGFTLAEMLVALFIFALIGAAGTALLSQSLRAREAAADAAAEIETTRYTHTLLKQDLLHAVSRPSGGPLGFSGGNGTAVKLSFARTGFAADHQAQSALVAVRYLFEDGVLSREINQPADSADAAAHTREVLADGLRAVDIAFWTGRDWVRDWGSTDWPSERLPAAVRFTVAEETGRAKTLFFLTRGAL